MLTWKWTHKLGKLTSYEDTKDDKGEEVTYVTPLTIYTGGNCLAVLLYEYKEGEVEKYQLGGFFDDIKHVQNFLNDNKDSNKRYELELMLYKTDGLSKERKTIANSINKELLKMVQLFVQFGAKVVLTAQDMPKEEK